MNDAPEQDQLRPGTRVRVVKQVARQLRPLSSVVEGVVVRHEQRKTGSWFAHSKDDRLWLDRLVIRKADGELYVANLDGQSVVEIVRSDAATDEPVEPVRVISPATRDPEDKLAVARSLSDMMHDPAQDSTDSAA